MHDFHADEWLVQPALCRLSKDGRTVQVRAKVMDVLEYLAARPGEVVSKETLLDGVWGAREISESALTRTVTELRQALGDEVAKPRFLETIPKRGYRFIAPVTPVAEGRPHPATQIAHDALEPEPLKKELSRHRLGAALAAGALVLVVVGGWWMLPQQWFAAHDTPALAVLPFSTDWRRRRVLCRWHYGGGHYGTWESRRAAGNSAEHRFQISGQDRLP